MPEAVAVLRSITFAVKVRGAPSLQATRDLLREEALHIEKAMETAAAQREAFWVARVNAVMEVADLFKSTLDHFSNGLLAKQKKVK